MIEVVVLKRTRAEADDRQRKFYRKTAKGRVIKGAFSAAMLSRFCSCMVSPSRALLEG